MKKTTRAARFTFGLLTGALLLVHGGCGDHGPQRVAVSGTITLDGEPVNNATIIFTPQGDGVAAAAEVSAGKFALTEVDGPTPGAHSIRINPNEPELEEFDPAVASRSRKQTSIPPTYQHAGALSATILSDSQPPLQFRLTSN